MSDERTEYVAGDAERKMLSKDPHYGDPLQLWLLDWQRGDVILVAAYPVEGDALSHWVPSAGRMALLGTSLFSDEMEALTLALERLERRKEEVERSILALRTRVLASRVAR